MADHRISAVAFRGHSDVTVHGAQIPDQSVVCYGHRAVFRGNARRRARIELSDAACRTTDHGARHGCFPAAADQHHSRQGSIPQARHDAWVGEFGDVRGSGHRAGVRRIGDGIPELALDFLCHDSVPGDFVRAWRGYRA